MARKATSKTTARSNTESTAASDSTQNQDTHRYARKDWERLTNAEKAVAWTKNEEPAETPDEQGQYLIGWYDSTMDASYWLDKRSEIPADQAAQILSGSNPNHPEEESKWLDVTKWKDDAEGVPLMCSSDKRMLLRGFEEVGGKRTLIEWLNLAKQRGWRYDPWVDEYIVARSTFGDPLSHQGVASMSAMSSRTRVDMGLSEGVERASEVKKRARRDLLTPVIEAAQKECEDPFDASAVWAALVQFAATSRGPLVGVTEEGIKWKDVNDDLRYFSIFSLRARLRRSKNARKG